MRRNVFGPALAIALAMTCVPAQAQLNESPITPGFWTWPRDKLSTPEAIANSCREKFAVQFSDGRYFGVQLRAGDKALAAPVVDEVGRCRFSRDTQVERCDLRVHNADGTVTVGVIESRFSSEPDGKLKMSVVATVPGPQPKVNAFDVFPVRCPDDTVWDALNSVQPTR
jgi:hypothetical protein